LSSAFPPPAPEEDDSKLFFSFHCWSLLRGGSEDEEDDDDDDDLFYGKETRNKNDIFLNLILIFCIRLLYNTQFINIYMYCILS